MEVVEDPDTGEVMEDGDEIMSTETLSKELIVTSEVHQGDRDFGRIKRWTPVRKNFYILVVV